MYYTYKKQIHDHMFDPNNSGNLDNCRAGKDDKNDVNTLNSYVDTSTISDFCLTFTQDEDMLTFELSNIVWTTK
jgi:NifU-like protein involved in Fe-S cluster formation